jgi:hypothetical protein
MSGGISRSAGVAPLAAPAALRQLWQAAGGTEEARQQVEPSGAERVQADRDGGHPMSTLSGR